MKYNYRVMHSRNAIYTRDFTSRRKAEAYIAHLRRRTGCGDANYGSFTIHRTAADDTDAETARLRATMEETK